MTTIQQSVYFSRHTKFGRLTRLIYYPDNGRITLLNLWNEIEQDIHQNMFLPAEWQDLCTIIEGMKELWRIHSAGNPNIADHTTDLIINPLDPQGVPPQV